MIRRWHGRLREELRAAVPVAALEAPDAGRSWQAYSGWARPRPRPLDGPYTTFGRIK